MKKILPLFIYCAFIVTASAQSHWESIVLAENTWSYFEGNSEPDANWNTATFDDSTWKQGPGGLGYDDEDDSTIVEPVASLYLRKTFQIDDLALIGRLLLDVDYDDGFVAYVNGTELARSLNVTAEDPTFDSGTSIYHEAVMYTNGMPEQYELKNSVLTTGENVLAIHILNSDAASSDLSAIVYLHAWVNSSATLYQSIPIWFTEGISNNSSRLPIVKITTNDQEIVDDPKITAHMGIINNGYGNLNYLTDTFTDYDGSIGIETRGQSSQEFNKKSYGFETRDEFGENLNVNLMGMPKENDWILYAPYSDKSMLRNAITFELAKSLNTYSSRTAYCEVYIDDIYKGVYILMEKIKRDDSRVDIDSLESISGDDNSLSGGYIFKVDKTDNGYINTYEGWSNSPAPSYPNAKDITFQYVYPKAKNIETNERTYLQGIIAEAEDALIASDFDNKETGYNSYFNLGSFVDFMLINEITKEVDKFRYSTYFYKKKESKGGEVYAGPIWDFNLGYGNVNYWDEGNKTSGWMHTDVQDYQWSIMYWWKRLMEDPYFESIATSRYRELRNEDWSDENFTYLIDSITNYIDEAQVRNFTKWDILGKYVWPNMWWENMTYDEEVDSLKSWTLRRMEWMDNNLLGTDLIPAVTLTLSNDQSFPNFMNVEVKLEDAYFNHSQLKKKYFDVKNSYQDLYVDSVWYTDANTASLLIGSKELLNANDVFAIKVDDNILTGFNDLLSNNLAVTAAIDDTYATNTVKTYTAHQHIIVETVHPELLGKTLQVYTIDGKLIKNYQLASLQRNEIKTALHSGVYLLSFTYNGEVHSETVLF